MNDLNDVPAPTSRQAARRQAPRRHVPARTALLAALGLIAAGCTGTAPEQTKGPVPESLELTLQPVGAAGPDPFTPSSATAESAPVQPPLPNASGRGIRTVGAATPGLYGGTNRLGSCDVERQVAFLTSDAAKARTFAQAAGIEQEKIPDFLRALTPVVLRADTRVTNHGFRDGRAEGYQSVLQAGTAVLVDDHGMPRVRCGCGNPLAAPRSAKGNPVLKGDQWNGYQPTQVIVIEPTIQVIKRLVIVNVADNTWIERKAGDDGAQDKPPRALPPYDPADGIPNAPATPADDPCAGAEADGRTRTTPPSPPPPAGPPTPSAGPSAPSAGPSAPSAGPPAAGPDGPPAQPPLPGPGAPDAGEPPASDLIPPPGLDPATPAEPPASDLIPPPGLDPATPAEPPASDLIPPPGLDPATPPAAPGAAGPPAADPVGPGAATPSPSPSPCPSAAGTAPRAPAAPQDVPGGLPPSDGPAATPPDAGGGLPPDQAPTYTPDDGPGTGGTDPAPPPDAADPAAPDGFPDGFPDGQQVTDQPPYLESA
ncbi:DUF6777 domain-containing protein [Streptomyces sp. NPDC047976]|uniref:DUF6777 domain-containing protein n=1 Tax=Streptomyces sp. NPDC047976 TaxID=3155746 RepID=UPI003427FCD8